MAKHTYIYPKWVFTPYTNITIENKRRYEKMVDKWYETAEALFPDYYKLNLRQKLSAHKILEDILGYTI